MGRSVGALPVAVSVTYWPRPGRRRPSRGWGRAEGPDGEGVLQRAETRHTIELSTGMRWERLTPRHDSRVDFLDVVYEPYGRSS